MIALFVESAGRSFLLFALMLALIFVLRIRNKSGELAAWRVALLSAFLIPLLLKLRVVSIPVSIELSPLLLAVTGEPGTNSLFELTAVLTVLYLAIAAMLILRLSMGVFAAWRLHRTAHKPNFRSLDDSQALVSDAVTVPITVGSSVLLPEDYSQWSAYKLQAVLAHETTHARNGDFYWHVASLLYRAVFWINPLAWWLPKRMAELAEARCDRIAVKTVGEAAEYAQLLVDFSKKPNSARLAVAMAQSADLQRRVEQLLNEKADYSAPSGRLHQIGAFTVVLATVVVCAACGHEVDTQRQAANTPQASSEKTVPNKETMVPPRLPEGGSTKPKYDPSEREAGHQGTVYLQVLIDAGGRVTKVIIQKSSGYEALDNSALTEIRDHWHFIPGTQNGAPVDMWVTIPIVFEVAMKFPNPLAHGLAQSAHRNVDALG